MRLQNLIPVVCGRNSRGACHGTSDIGYKIEISCLSAGRFFIKLIGILNEIERLKLVLDI